MDTNGDTEYGYGYGYGTGTYQRTTHWIGRPRRPQAKQLNCTNAQSYPTLHMFQNHLRSLPLAVPWPLVPTPTPTAVTALALSPSSEDTLFEIVRFRTTWDNPPPDAATPCQVPPHPIRLFIPICLASRLFCQANHKTDPRFHV